MLTTLAAALIPVVMACQLAALAVLWRRYRMPGAGWWLLATLLVVAGSVGQLIEESGWRPWPLVATVNVLFAWYAITELTAARLLTGQTAPSRRKIPMVAGLALVWGVVAAIQADRYREDLFLFGVLRVPNLVLMGLSLGAIAASLVRLARRGHSAGGYLAAAGYLLMVLDMTMYPFSFERPWLRAAGMANAALAFMLIGWGMLLIVLERRQADLLRQATVLAGEAASQADRVMAVAQQARSQAALLSDRAEQAELGQVAVELAEELLSTVGILRQSTVRLQSGTTPQERAAVIAQIEGVLRDLSLVAAGVLTTGSRQSRTEALVDCRHLLDGLLREMVPPTVGVMTAWPGPEVWVRVEVTLLQVALHQAIRFLLVPDQSLERLSVALERDADLTLNLQQVLTVRGDGAPSGDALALKLAQLAVRRLGGQLVCQDGHLGRRLVITLPLAEAGPSD